MTKTATAGGIEDDMSILPKIPDQFVGREVDIYEILESLRVDDVIRIESVECRVRGKRASFPCSAYIFWNDQNLSRSIQYIGFLLLLESCLIQTLLCSSG